MGRDGYSFPFPEIVHSAEIKENHDVALNKRINFLSRNRSIERGKTSQSGAIVVMGFDHDAGCQANDIG